MTTFRRVLLPLLALACMLACTSSDDSTIGISGNVNVSGNWLYSTSNVQSNPITCSSSGTVLTLTQQGTTVTGTYSGGTLTCSTGTYSIGSGTIAAGTASGSTVAFDLNNSAWHNTGTAGGTSMSGSVTLSVALNNMNYTLTGTWVATKQ